MSWSKHFSEKGQKHYYFHSITRISQFDKPSNYFEKSMVKVKISYTNSPIDSKKVAQLWSENTMTFSELLNKIFSKVKLPLFNSDKCEVQLWNYDGSEEPMGVSMDDTILETFAICDKIPQVTVEFLLHKVKTDLTPQVATTGETDEIQQLLIDIEPESLDKDQLTRVNTADLNDEVEKLVNNIEPQLSNTDQITKNINNLWEEVKCAVDAYTCEEEQPQHTQTLGEHPQILGEKLSLQRKEEEKITSSKNDSLNDEIEEKIAIAVNFPSLPLYLSNSEIIVAKRLKSVRFLDDVNVDERGNSFLIAELPRQYSRLGDYMDNGDNNVYHYPDNDESIDMDLEEEFKEQEELSDDDSYILDNISAKKIDGYKNNNNHEIVKYEDVNKSSYSAEQQDISDEEFHTRYDSSPIDTNNNDKGIHKYEIVKYEDINNNYSEDDCTDHDDREQLRSDPKIKQNVRTNTCSGLKILCCDYLGAQLGLKRNGIPFSCPRDAWRCSRAHICVKSYPMEKVLERLEMVIPTFRNLVLPAYKKQKERERKKEITERNKILQKAKLKKTREITRKKKAMTKKSKEAKMPPRKRRRNEINESI